jgi:hypothetical protein
VSDVRLVAREGVPLCAVCKEPGEVVACELCYAGYHTECVVGGKCPSIGCTNAADPAVPQPKTERVQCSNCKGSGKEIVNEMCRAQVYDCERCRGKGHIERPVEKSGAFIIPTARGLEIAGSLSQAAASLSDVVDRKRAEDDLRREVQMLRHDLERNQERSTYMHKVAMVLAAMFMAVIFSTAWSSILRVLGDR